MKNIFLSSMLFLIASCGGGGGGGASAISVPFALVIGLTSFSVDEDSSYEGSIVATANETVTLSYTISSEPTQGSITLQSSGSISYTPNSNFNGTDQFQYSVNVAEKNLDRSATVNITINPVNDAPVFSFETATTLSKETMLFDDNQTFRVKVGDIDNTLDELTFDLLVGSESIPATFTLDAGENPTGTGSLSVDLSSLQKAGLYSAALRADDGVNKGTVLFESWFISNKTTVTIEQDDDPEDGYDGGDKTSKDYFVYYLSGNSTSFGKTKYLFIADSMSGEINSNGTSDIELYRRALLASINKLNDSDASEYFSSDYFTIVSAEPVTPDGTSPVGVRTGCYDFDEDVYCIGDMDRAIFDVLLPDNTLISTLTRVDGRGVNIGNRNIQRIRENDPERTRHTLMHELGHAHGYMGDEYRSDERDLTDNGYNVNTTTQSDVSLLKWKHHLSDPLNVLGKDVLVCYNYGDGTIGDWDDLGITVDQCDCFANRWSLTPDVNGDYSFLGKNPECAGVGLFEGNYYGLYDNYRPTFCSVMDSCSSGGYGKVNVEGFAVGSIQNQGFYEEDDINFVSNDAGANTGFQIILDANYDTSKLTLKWYVDGVEDTSKQNQTTVTFNRPVGNGVEIYTAKAIDLTGTIQATDDVIDNTDFYEGAFQSFFYWCAGLVDNDSCDWSYSPNPSTYSNFDYGYMRGPLGVTWGINWAQW